MGKRKTTSDFIKNAIEVHGEKYDYSLVEYKKSFEHVTIICPYHGVFKQIPNNHLRGAGCKLCAAADAQKRYSLSTQDFIKNAIEVHGEKYDYSLVEYKNWKTPVDIICKDHGVFKQIPNKHVSAMHGCPECGGSLVKTKTDFICDSKKVHENRYDYSLVEYKNSKSVVEIVCPNHGIFLQTPDSHINKNAGCPKCVGAISNHEVDITNFIKTIYDGQIITNSRGIIPPKELDIYIPEYNLAIEYCGLYWHSENMGKDKWYHYKKYMECLDKDIQLLTIFEDEWLYRKEQVKSKISHLLQKTEDKIYARNCDINIVDYKTSRDFIDKYHIQGGNTKPTLSIGLFYHSSLVAVLQLQLKFDDTWDILRFSTSCSVVGGFGKLLKFFERNYIWSVIQTFSDNRWSDGGLYHKTGFDIDKHIGPEYYYVVGLTRMHKFNFRHTTGLKKLKTYDPNLSESDNMSLANISRIWDCGKLKFMKINEG